MQELHDSPGEVWPSVSPLPGKQASIDFLKLQRFLVGEKDANKLYTKLAENLNRLLNLFPGANDRAREHPPYPQAQFSEIEKIKTYNVVFFC